MLDEKCWGDIVKGCDYIIHTASPFPSKNPKNENDLIEPAVNGTKFVLNAAIKYKIKHVVITSSIAAI